MTAAKKAICVVLVIDDLEYGGAQRQVIELANNMDRDHFDTHVCTLSDYVPLGNQLKNFEQRLHIIRKKNRIDITIVLRLARLLKGLNADIVHSYLFASDIASRLAGRLAGTKLIIGSERNSNHFYKKRNVLAYKLTRKCADFIIANSKTGAQYNSKTFNRPLSDYRIIYNGVDIERFRPRDRITMRNRLDLSPVKHIIGMFASFAPQKNHFMLIQAFKKVLDCFPDTQLLFVGDRYYSDVNSTGDYIAKMEGLIDELGIRHQCTFLGNQDDVEFIYPACDITVLPSLFEGTANVLLESMACGIPVVATNICDNPHVVREVETGFLVEVGDVEGMAERIKVLLSNDALCREMGKKARTWVLKEFSLGQLARNTEAVYVEALNTKCERQKARSAR